MGGPGLLSSKVLRAFSTESVGQVRQVLGKAREGKGAAALCGLRLSRGSYVQIPGKGGGKG